MGGAAASFTITSFPFFLTITTLILIHPSIARSNDESNEDGIPLIEDDTRPPPAAAGHREKKSDAMKPSAAVVVGVLTTTFSLSFLLLLYIKHCNGGGGTTFVARGGGDPHRNPQAAPEQQQRKDSGVDREVVESLPMFHFGSLRGRKNGLECAVCLTGFEDREVLRLLPKCRHAFHVDCVDTWLHAHSTCPLCRYKIHREDVVVDTREEEEEEEAASDIDAPPGNENRRASGSNSSAREGDEEFLEIVLQTPKNDTETSSFRGSLEEEEEEEEGVVACPEKNGGPLGGRMSGEHRVIFSPSSRGGVHEERSDCEPLDVLYLKSEMIISGGRRRRTASEHKQDDVAAVGSDEIEDGVLRSVSETTALSRFVRGKNQGKGTRG